MRQAIIVGGSRGIGFAIAKKFLSHEIGVTLVSPTKVNLQRSVDSLQQFATTNGLSATAKYGVCNVADEKDIERYCHQLVTLFSSERKPIDILVNSAGITYNKLLIASATQTVKDILNTNLLGTILFTRIIAKQMIRQNHGSIVSIGSIVGTNGNVGQSVYGASKAGLVGFTKSLAKELAPKGITVNLVLPGFIETEMTTGSLSSAQMEKMRSKIPLQRLGSAGEVADVTYFLATSPYISGQQLTVDGGLRLVF